LESGGVNTTTEIRSVLEAASYRQNTQSVGDSVTCLRTDLTKGGECGVVGFSTPKAIARQEEATRN